MERGLDYATAREAYHGMVGERVGLIPTRDPADV